MSPRLSPIKCKELIGLLEDRGFRRIGQKGSHLKMKNDRTKKTVIVPVHRGQDIDPALLASIFEQAGIDANEFRK